MASFVDLPLEIQFLACTTSYILGFLSHPMFRPEQIIEHSCYSLTCVVLFGKNRTYNLNYPLHLTFGDVGGGGSKMMWGVVSESHISDKNSSELRLLGVTN